MLFYCTQNIYTKIKRTSIEVNMNSKEISYQEYINRENELLHAPFDPELEFYNYVKLGDIDKVTQLCTEPLTSKEGLGILSDDYIKHIRYHFIITTAMVARYCIEGGMELSRAYTLSDYYIRKSDELKTAEEIAKLHDEMCLDYTSRMNTLNKSKSSSSHISKALDYIYNNLHVKITSEEIADHVGLNPSYFSRLFKSEIGVSVSEYIRNKKIEVAQNMLKYTNYSVAEISTTLAFPTQSYFTEQFKKQTGMTPAKYRSDTHHQFL